MSSYYELIRKRGKIIELREVKIILVDTDDAHEIERIKQRYLLSIKKRKKRK